MTLDANSMGTVGPISKFQSPGVFILIDLSISILNLASGAPGILKLGQIWEDLGSKNDDFRKFQD